MSADPLRFPGERCRLQTAAGLSAAVPAGQGQGGSPEMMSEQADGHGLPACREMHAMGNEDLNVALHCCHHHSS